MEMIEKVKKVIQDIILSELEEIKGENQQIKTILEFTNKRLDDINAHLIDQSRRIDETNKKINKGMDELNKRIDDLRVELGSEIAKNNMRIDRLYEVIVRREEYEKVEIKIQKLEQEVIRIKTAMQGKIAA